MIILVQGNDYDLYDLIKDIVDGNSNNYRTFTDVEALLANIEDLVEDCFYEFESDGIGELYTIFDLEKKEQKSVKFSLKVEISDVK